MKQKNNKSSVQTKRSFKRQSAGALVRGLTSQAIQKKGFMRTEIIIKWSKIVGPDYADVVQPLSLRFPQGKRYGGTLEVRTHSSYAPLLQQSSRHILDKINIFFGYQAVEFIAIKQGPMPKKKVRRVHKTQPMTREQTQLIDQITAEHSNTDLGKAVQSMLTTAFMKKN